MRHLIETTDWTDAEIQETLELARTFSDKKLIRSDLKNRSLCMLFFNPSLRTRVSFIRAMEQLGGAAVTLDVGKDTWKLAKEDGVVMNGDEVEHVREAIPVLGRYSDFLAIRDFAEDSFFRRAAELSTVPLINMESAMAHPCQAFADILTIQKFTPKPNPKVVLTWTSHPKSLPMAVPNSFALLASRMGWDLTLVRPEGFELRSEVTAQIESYSQKSGGTFQETNDREKAFSGASVIYAKSWGSLKKVEGPKDWIVDAERLQKTDDAIFLHCLPIRRNVEATDEVLNSSRSRVVDLAENRLHVQKAILCQLAKWNFKKELN